MSVVELLIRDIQAAGADKRDAVLNRAEQITAFHEELDTFREQLVRDVQQDLHCERIDTTWPACPRHHSHPLWLNGDAWFCEHDNVAIARLGEL